MAANPAIDDARKHPQRGSNDVTEGEQDDVNEEVVDGYPGTTAALIYGIYPLLLIVFILVVAVIVGIRYFLM